MIPTNSLWFCGHPCMHATGTTTCRDVIKGDAIRFDALVRQLDGVLRRRICRLQLSRRAFFVLGVLHCRSSSLGSRPAAARTTLCTEQNPDLHSLRAERRSRAERTSLVLDKGNYDANALLGLFLHDPMAGILDDGALHVACNRGEFGLHGCPERVITADRQHRHG